MRKNLSFFLLAVSIPVIVSMLAMGFRSPGRVETGPVPLRVGWIGPLSGPASAYGSWKAASLALKEVNDRGGIRGRPLELLAEDGRCDGAHAASAAHKLIRVAHVRFILGGHCAAESKAIAPIAESAAVIQLAATTSTPKLSSTRRYVFRITAIGLKVSESLAPFSLNRLGVRRLAILHEMTEYAAPVAEHLGRLISEGGGAVSTLESFNPGTTDFRGILTRIRSGAPQALYIGVQAPDTASLIYQQMHEIGLLVPVLANEVAGHAALKRTPPGLDGHVFFSEPSTDPTSSAARAFMRSYFEAYQEHPPLGLLTAESYDAVHLLAESIARCGEEVEQVRGCLSLIRDRTGASGTFSIDSNGDGVREYRVVRVLEGRPADPELAGPYGLGSSEVSTNTSANSGGLSSP